jgi:hypothetical protein
MSEQSAVIIGIVGICVTVINGMGLFILVGIRSDLRSAKDDLKKEIADAKVKFEDQIEKIWKRVFRHGHEVICANDDCHPIRLGGVIVPPDHEDWGK